MSIFSFGPPRLPAGTPGGDRHCCRPDDERVACAGRYAAVRENRFRWDSTLAGWRFVAAVDVVFRRFTARARYVFEALAARRHDRPVTYDDCPWCGEPLPDLAHLMGEPPVATERPTIRRRPQAGSGPTPDAPDGASDGDA